MIADQSVMLFAIIIKGNIYYKTFKIYDFLSSVEHHIYFFKDFKKDISFCVKKKKVTQVLNNIRLTLFLVTEFLF